MRPTPKTAAINAEQSGRADTTTKNRYHYCQPLGNASLANGPDNKEEPVR